MVINYSNEVLKQQDEQTNSTKRKIQKKGYASLKIDKEYKILFDELVHQHRTKQVDFLEELLEHWCKDKDQDVYEQFKNKELPNQKK